MAHDSPFISVGAALGPARRSLPRQGFSSLSSKGGGQDRGVDGPAQSPRIREKETSGCRGLLSSRPRNRLASATPSVEPTGPEPLRHLLLEPAHSGFVDDSATPPRHVTVS